jgi:hypothetical protein
MRRYLIVANQTLTGPHLVAEATARQVAEPSSFHLLVPATRSHAGALWTEGEARARARKQLDDALAEMTAAGLQVTGELGDESPVQAVGDALRQGAFDEIIVSTLPPGLSRWLKLDLPHRLETTYGLPVKHVMPSRDLVT